MATLEIRDLHVSVEESPGVHREILRGVDLTVGEGETHAIMGPNGSGKSTLAYAIAGHPKYLVTKGSVRLDGEDVLAIQRDAARGDDVLRVAGDGVGESRLTGAVRAHDRVGLAGRDRQVDAAQDLPRDAVALGDGHVKVADLKGGHL